MCDLSKVIEIYCLYTGVVFLDLKNPLDTVEHQILLHKLAKHKRSLDVVGWFGNYLLIVDTP